MSKFVTQGRRSAVWIALLAVVGLTVAVLGGCGGSQDTSAPAGAPPKNSRDNADYQKMQQKKS